MLMQWCSCLGKAVENKYVLSLFLTMLMVGADLMCNGRGFQRVGAAYEKVRCSNDLSFQLGTWSSSWFEDRSERMVVFLLIMFLIYPGSNP